MKQNRTGLVMDLDAQIELLIEKAPKNGVAPEAITAIAPTLKAIAGQLQHPQYYILQTLEQGWLMTTLSNRNQPDAKKNIIYGFPSLQDAAASTGSSKDPQIMAIPVPVTHILFQMLAMSPVDSTIFFEVPGVTGQGVEVRRQDVQNLVQLQLQQATQQNPVPPDLA